MEIKTKRFRELYPTYDDWKANVWEKVLALFAPELPAYLDAHKMIYKPALLFNLFNNRYSEWACINEDEKTHQLFINALINTLPSLYAKTQVLSTETMALMKPDALFKDIEKRFNDDPDNQYASTETTYSSTPTTDLAAGTFKTEHPKEKNIIFRKDGTVRVKEFSNYLSKIQELGKTTISGYVDEFINSIEFSSLFISIEADDARYIVIINTKFGDGSLTTTQSRALTDAEFAKIGISLFGDGAKTSTQKRALTDAEIKKLEEVVAGGLDNPELEAEVKLIWNSISQAEADVDIEWVDDTHLNYLISGTKVPMPYQVIDITTAGSVISSTSQVDVWSRIKNKNNQYEIILTKNGEKLKYTFSGGYEITITATADGGNAKFLYNADASKIFIVGTNATLTDNKGHANVALIQLDIGLDTIGATSAKANYEFTLAAAPTKGDIISKLMMKTSNEKLLNILLGALKLFDKGASIDDVEDIDTDIKELETLVGVK